MKDTRILKATKENFELAKQEILQGDVVAIPTETAVSYTHLDVYKRQIYI